MKLKNCCCLLHPAEELGKVIEKVIFAGKRGTETLHVA
jgi:hypothetical protein